MIHVIDSVILPASDNIPETADKAGKFSTLLAAAKAAGLVEALSGKGPITVFAPTDEAFAKLPEGTVDTLLRPENKAKLADILKYHVVAGRVYSSDALSAGKAKTLQGGSIKITAKGNVAKVNDAKLILTDLDASNGVIHVIDSVILPPKGEQASADPKKMIRLAINEGVPKYNAGHPSECANIYMETVRNLMVLEDYELSPGTMETLQTAYEQAQHSNCSNTKAWTLRRALDVAYLNMNQVQ